MEECRSQPILASPRLVFSRTPFELIIELIEAARCILPGGQAGRRTGRAVCSCLRLVCRVCVRFCFPLKLLSSSAVCHRRDVNVRRHIDGRPLGSVTKSSSHLFCEMLIAYKQDFGSVSYLETLTLIL